MCVRLDENLGYVADDPQFVRKSVEVWPPLFQQLDCLGMSSGPLHVSFRLRLFRQCLLCSVHPVIAKDESTTGRVTCFPQRKHPVRLVPSSPF